MKLYIMNDGRIRHKWWLNFRDHCIKIRSPGYLLEVDIQLEAYSAEYFDSAWPLGDPYIEFANEQDATMFLLRWS